MPLSYKEGAVWHARDGRSYFDLSGGALVQSLLSTSAEPPSLATYANVSASAGFFTPVRAELEALLQRALPPHYSGFLWASSGSDGVELAIAAIAASRRRLGFPEIETYLVRRGSYHGATALTRALSTRRADPLKLQLVPTVALEEPGNLDGWARHVSDQVTSGSQAASALLLLESVPTTGRVFWPGEENYRSLFRCCAGLSVPIILDEVASGVYRHGWFSAADWLGDGLADAIVLGKGLTCGAYPLSCVLIRDDHAATLRGSSDRLPGFTIALNDPAAHFATSCLRAYSRLQEDGAFRRRQTLVKRMSGQLEQLGKSVMVESTDTTIRLSFDDRALAQQLAHALRSKGMLIYSAVADFPEGQRTFFHVCPAFDLQEDLAADVLEKFVQIAASVCS